MNAQPAASQATTETAKAPTPQHAEAASEKDVDKRYVFKMTPMAVRKLYDNLRKRKTPESALRVGVRGGGCSGFSYVLEFSDKPPRSRDLVFNFEVDRKADDEEDPGTVRVVCDKKSILFLNDTTLDWEKTLMYQGYRFVNPKEKSSCGCKESFAV